MSNKNGQESVVEEQPQAKIQHKTVAIALSEKHKEELHTLERARARALQELGNSVLTLLGKAQEAQVLNGEMQNMLLRMADKYEVLEATKGRWELDISEGMFHLKD